MPRVPRLSRALVVAPAVAAALWLLPEITRAQHSDRIALRWSAPSECPDTSAVKAEVDRLLGPTAARPAQPIDVSAVVSRDDRGGWSVHLETRREGTTRERELHGASCAAIADATALILAMMIDPTAALAAPPSSAAPSASPAEAPPSLPEAPSSPPKAPPPPADSSAALRPTTTARPRAQSPAPPTPPTPLSFRSALWGGLDTGSLPGVSGGLGVAEVLVYGAQRFEFGAALRPPRKATVEGRPTSGGDVDLFTVFVATCRNLLLAPLEIGPCVSFELGAIHASGFGVTSPGEGAFFWAAIEADPVSMVWSPIPRAALSVRLGAAVPLRRSQFVLENIGPVHRPARWVHRASIGAEILF